MRKNTNTDKKKKRRRRIIIGIIVVLVLAFFLWPADDEYDEAVYDSAEVGEAASGSGANDREELAQYFGSDVVRDHYVTLKGDGSDTVTVMVYMNGSDLESEDNEATTDLTEMVKGFSGGSDKVNIIVQTMGTKKWNSKYGISSKKTERYLVGQNGLTLVDGTLSQLDCTKASTLADFIKWGRDNYPAD